MPPITLFIGDIPPSSLFNKAVKTLEEAIPILETGDVVLISLNDESIASWIEQAALLKKIPKLRWKTQNDKIRGILRNADSHWKNV